MASSQVVDTSVWIEWLSGGALGRRLGRQLPDQAHCIVPTLVQVELSKWLLREADEDRADQMIAYTCACNVVPLDTSLALLAAEMHRDYKLATADAIIYATARQFGAELLTCDAHFKALPAVIWVPKKA